MHRKRPCRIRRRWFVPDFRAEDRQQACGAADCQRERHRRNCQRWYRREAESVRRHRLERRLRALEVDSTETAMIASARYGTDNATAVSAPGSRAGRGFCCAAAPSDPVENRARADDALFLLHMQRLGDQFSRIRPSLPGRVRGVHVRRWADRVRGHNVAVIPRGSFGVRAVPVARRGVFFSSRSFGLKRLALDKPVRPARLRFAEPAHDRRRPPQPQRDASSPTALASQWTPNAVTGTQIRGERTGDNQQSSEITPVEPRGGMLVNKGGPIPVKIDKLRIGRNGT